MTEPVHIIKIILRFSIMLHGFNGGKSYLLSQGTLEVNQNNCSLIHIVALGILKTPPIQNLFSKNKGHKLAYVAATDS